MKKKLKQIIFFSVFKMNIYLEVLDGKEINEVTRQFLINWKASKEARKNKNNSRMLPGSLIPFSLTSMHGHPTIYKFLYLKAWF